MFTGLVQKVGQLESLARTGDTWTVVIGHEAWGQPLEHGESVAVQGACLTVAMADRGRFQCNVLDETLSRTNLGRKLIGSPLNLERALRLGDRLGGHMVAGHVDGVGTVASLGRSGADWVLRVACETCLADEIILKGSIAVDGVSLTVSDVGERHFEVRIIPVTWDHTSLASLSNGAAVNLETDMIGKYVRKFLGQQEKTGLTWDDLGQAGIL